MGDLAKQLGSTLAAAFAAACCLGAAAALSALSAVGAGFLINDAVLIPAYVGLLALSLGLLYRSARAHGSRAPFRLGAAGALAALAGLWIHPALVYGGLLALVAGSAFDAVRRLRRARPPTPASRTSAAREP